MRKGKRDLCEKIKKCVQVFLHTIHRMLASGMSAEGSFWLLDLK